MITYEAAWGQEDKTYEARVDSDGKLLELEHTVTRDELPDAVRKKVKRFLPKGDPIFELKMSVTYEAEVEIDDCTTITSSIPTIT